MSVLLLSNTAMNIWNLHSPVNTEYLVDSTIHMTEENHEEDNLSIGDSTDYCLTEIQSLPGSQCPYIISGISPSVWQPPE
jgi:hypothetical protein